MAMRFRHCNYELTRMAPETNDRILQEQRLWEGLRTGDGEAFNELFRNYGKKLFSYGSRFCSDRDLLKDCIQELFVGLWNKRADIPLPSSIKWYLFVALRNRIFREQTRWNRNSALAEEYDFVIEYNIEEQMIAHAEDMELAQKLKRVLEGLPPRQREIIYLRYYEDLDHDQIASLMEINKQSVHNLLQKAYKSIRLDWVPLITLLCKISYAGGN
ncbi:RNA polymerase sigma factor [Pedobacter sp. SYP-B3415]|uniref:RNA polymerase sigma factor n=1 Tax=Pedobacter sp. SYP-B3415 TaxID=2496641 RepID=UPI00101D7EB4|nr:sigma-70 family RNA polymerase sigma factor [Pedobacter sp. SYP-B3415]